MQKDDQILDRYLKDKVEQAHFDFDEDYWLKVSAMLDEEDKRKKRPFLWRWITLLCVVLAAGAGTMVFTGRNKNSDKQHIAEQTTQPASTSGQTNTGVHLPSEVSYQADRPENQTANQQTAPASSLTAPTVPNKPSDRINLPQQQNTSQQADTNVDIVDTPSPTKTSLPIASNRNHAPAVQQGQGKTMVANKAPQTATRGSGNQYKARPIASLSALPTKDLPVSDVDKPHAAPDPQQKTVTVNGKQMIPIDTETYVRKVPRDETIYNPRYQAGLRDYQTERIDSVTVYTYQPLPETKPATINAAPVSPQPIVRDTVIKTHKNKALKFYVAGGATLNKGFNGNMNTSVSGGIAPYLHVGAEKPLSDKISLAAQIGFTYFNALNVQKKVTSYKYSFGFDSTQFTVNYQRMYQLFLPLSLSYELNHYHTVLASLGGSYVINTLNKVNDQGNTTRQSGYSGGINPFDLFAQVGYQYTLDRRFAVQALIHQGFLSATQKDYFNINHANTQTRISLGLKYYFKRNGQ